ncbi:hypothetical protein FMN63_28430 [Stappia sp. BW2]|nr:hypothetical protein FMN63_28430 [Stappia sp. BW2]
MKQRPGAESSVRSDKTIALNFTRAIVIVLTAALAGGTAGLIKGYADVTRNAELKLGLFAQQTEGLLAKYRHIPLFLASHPTVVTATIKETGSVELDDLLQQTVIATNAFGIVLLLEDGKPLAHASRRISGPAPSEAGAEKAIGSSGILALKRRFTLDRRSGKRLYEFAFGIRDVEKAETGTVAVYVDLEDFEIGWRSQSELIFLQADDGTVVASNEAGLLMKKTPVQDAAILSLPGTYRIGDLPGFWLGTNKQSFVTGTRLYVLSPASSLFNYFVFGAVSIAAIAALFFTTFRYLQIRRHLILRRLDEEQSAKELLEQAVQERTRSLRAEMAQRKDAQDRMRRLQAELAEGEKLRALGEMSVTISHEINQPLFALEALVDTIRVDLAADNDRSHIGPEIDRLSQIVDRIGDVVRNLRDFARDPEFEVEQVNLLQSVRDSIELLAIRLSRDGVEVDLKSREEEGPMVAAETVRLQQVIVNLMSNAADAAKTARCPRVIVEVAREEQEATVAVRDFGAGIERIEKIFDPFYTTKPTGEGMGLGLSISARIAAVFGGRITAANCSGGGAEFTLHLPLREPES